MMVLLFFRFLSFPPFLSYNWWFWNSGRGGGGELGVVRRLENFWFQRRREAFWMVALRQRQEAGWQADVGVFFLVFDWKWNLQWHLFCVNRVRFWRLFHRELRNRNETMIARLRGVHSRVCVCAGVLDQGWLTWWGLRWIDLRASVERGEVILKDNYGILGDGVNEMASRKAFGWFFFSLCVVRR